MIRAARSALAARAGRAFDLPTLGRTLAVCAPTIALYGATGDARWLLASIATVSIAIAVERVGIAPLGALAQGAAIVAGFLSLSCALSAWPAFVAGCATLAAAAVALSRCGARLRSLGNFVFIPSLYLTCEAAAAHHSATRLVPYLGAAMLPAIALSGVQAWRNAPAAHRLHALARWRGARELGRPPHRATRLRQSSRSRSRWPPPRCSSNGAISTTDNGRSGPPRASSRATRPPRA